MNKIMILIILFCYLSFTGCKNQEKHNHTESKEQHNHQEHDHSHTDHDHGEEGHSHDEQAHSHDDFLVEGDSHDEHDHGATALDPEDVKTQVIKEGVFREIIRTSGTILTPKSDEIIITAKTHGLVRFDGKNLVPGLKVTEGENLFRVSAENLAENNINVKVQQAKAQYELAKSNFERAQSLAADNIISQKEYLQAKAAFQQAEAEYNNLNHNFVASSSNIKTPAKGYLKEILVKEGDFVADGQALAVMIRNEKLLLKADVPQQYFSEMPSINDAVFIPSYTEKAFEVNKLNGKVVSYGRHTEQSNYFTPFYFIIDYTKELLPGAYTEVYLRLKEIKNVIVVPKTAILEEAGNYYLYVKHMGEYEKAYVKPGGTDGINVLIKEGIKDGDEVVIKGAYQVKLATMNTAVPHGHSH